MREIELNGKQYKIQGDIIQRAISPWMAKVGSTGSKEYSDMSQASLEEYHDFRNGIGLESDLPSESNRLWWSEGIDFSTARSAVLGPLVNTAGTFGVAPVKIIDFESSTYGIGDGKISKWSGSAWALEGLLVENCEDAWSTEAANITCTAETTLKKVGSASAKMLATAQIAGATLIGYEDFSPSIDLSGYTEINLWIYSNASWPAGEIKLLLDDHSGCISATETLALPEISATTWTNVNLTLANPGSDTAIISVGIGVYNAIEDTEYIIIDQIVADGYMASPIDAIVATDTTDSYLVVSSAEVAMYYNNTTWKYMPHEAQGYLAFYDTKLRGIDTDGGTVRSSAANDIDGTWTTFDLSGAFGTVYDLFEGKLLADGTPIIYFCGTEGLFTIDITNEKAYKQEVQYPPTTYAGHKGMYWNGSVWVATGYGILKVTPSLATEIGPNQDDGLPSDYQGSIYDMVAVNNWLVYCVNGGTTDRSSILKRNSSYGGSLQVYTAGCHEAADTTDTITSTNASSQATSETLLNEIKADYNTHRTSTTYHVAGDATNIVASANASDLATAITLVNEIKADYNAHRILSGVHLGRDSDHDIVSADATDLATVITLANEIKTDFNLHLLSAGGAIPCLHYSPSSLYTNGRLWWGEGTSIKYMMFPDTTSNVKQISSYEYVDDSGYGKLPILRKLAVIPKVALGVGAITKSCDADDYIEVFYGLNGAAATTSLGTLKSSPRPTLLTFGSGLGIEFYTVQFAIKLFRNGGNTTSPELESLLFYYLPRPALIHAWTFNILCIEDNADAIITELEAIRDTKTLVVLNTTGDENKTGFDYNVAISNMPLRFWVEDRKQREGVISVTCEEVFNG